MWVCVRVCGCVCVCDVRGVGVWEESVRGVWFV